MDHRPARASRASALEATRSPAADASPQRGRSCRSGAKREPQAQVWQLLPAEGLLRGAQEIELGQRWFHHFTVEVAAHCVDALTGADGTPRSAYLDKHWTETDAISWVATGGERRMSPGERRLLEFVASRLESMLRRPAVCGARCSRSRSGSCSSSSSDACCSFLPRRPATRNV